MDYSTPAFPVFTISWNLLKLMSIESVMSFNHLILCHPILLLPSVFPSISTVQFTRSVVSDSLQPHELPGLPVHHQLLEFTKTLVH